MKKIRLVLCVCLFSLFLPSLVSADIDIADGVNEIDRVESIDSVIIPFAAGAWDTIYDKNIAVSSGSTNTTTVTSGGGDIRICSSGINAGNHISAQVYTSGGSRIYPFNFFNNTGGVSPYACSGKIDVRSYVGSDNKVKLYVKLTSLSHSSDTIRFVIQD